MAGLENSRSVARARMLKGGQEKMEGGKKEGWRFEVGEELEILGNRE